MKIGVLETGRPPEELADRYDDYPTMFATLLADGGFEFSAYAALDGELPDSIHDADGWLITGSKFGVYEDHDWIPPLEEFVRKAYAANVPLVGICFGHQLIAQALGGKVEKFKGGWSIGGVDYPFGGQDGDLKLLAWHQDQVIEKPAEAEVVSATPFCQYAALVYGDKAFTVQPHPEFSTAYVRDLVEARREILPAEVTEHADDLTGAETDAPRIAGMIIDFFQRRAAQAAE